MRQRSYRRALWHGVAAAVEHDAIPLRADFATVIDVGANRGQFAVVAARRFSRATLYCFEPLPGPRRRLCRAVGPTGRLRLLPIALGAAKGTEEFHVSNADVSSSLLPIGPRQRAAFPGSGERCTVKVPVRRLDETLTTDDLTRPVLLKIDVQGGELGVLLGSELAWRSIDAVLVEVSFVELYTGQALADEIWEFLQKRGFTCRGVWSVAYGPRKECVQADLLFARRGFEPLTA